MEKVDEEQLELVEMRLDIDVESLCAYLVANSDFPDGPVEIKQFNKGQSNPTVREARSRRRSVCTRSRSRGELTRCCWVEVSICSRLLTDIDT